MTLGALLVALGAQAAAHPEGVEAGLQLPVTLAVTGEYLQVTGVHVAPEADFTYAHGTMRHCRPASVVLSGGAPLGVWKKA